MKVEVTSATEESTTAEATTTKVSHDDSQDESEEGEEIELVKKPRQESAVANLV